MTNKIEGVVSFEKRMFLNMKYMEERVLSFPA